MKSNKVVKEKLFHDLLGKYLSFFEGIISHSALIITNLSPM